ncbi:MAG TPA: DUF1501 domain-containing protein [Isosphaeraceae bacterium]
MLTLWGPRQRYCDGRTRRSFLRLGGLALGGLALPDLLRLEARAGAGSGRSHKAVIMVYLSGGLAHQDTFDLKPEAPEEVRGEFRPIDSAVPGIRVGELLPRLAAVMDKLAVIRSIVGLRDEHSSWQNLTGYPMDQARREGRPHFGSVIAKVQGSFDPVVPPFVDMFPTMQHRPYNSGGPGHLGLAHAGARLGGEDAALMTQDDVTPERFDRRRALLGRFDDWRRAVDGPPVAGLDAFYRRAFDLLTSDRVARALDLGREDPRLRQKYGLGSSKPLGDGAPMWNDQLLVARRLVEAGARCVTVAYGFWDTHGDNFGHLRRHLPLFDQGLATLVEDIHARGLDRDVSVVVWGEFGRTPTINRNGGRDHWPRVNSCLLAGGGMRVGQAIGSTDKLGGQVVSTPIHYQDVLATIYHNLGIDPHGFVPDLVGRPIPILPSTARPIPQLL